MGPQQQLGNLFKEGVVRPPFLVGFSGIDGSGKSTQLARLADVLERLGVQPLCGKTSLHAATSIFRLSEKLSGDPYAYHPTIPATLREFAIACDVVKHHFDVIAPRLHTAPIILLDRCVFCYRIYAQVYQADVTWIAPLYDLIPAPDITLLLDVPVEVAYERRHQRQEKPAKSDEQADFLALIRQAYLDGARMDASVQVINAWSAPERVLEQICATLVAYIHQRSKEIEPE